VWRERTIVAGGEVLAKISGDAEAKVKRIASPDKVAAAHSLLFLLFATHLCSKVAKTAVFRELLL